MALNNVALLYHNSSFIIIGFCPDHFDSDAKMSIPQLESNL